MKQRPKIVVFVFLMAFLVTMINPGNVVCVAEVVEIPDPGLEGAIRDALDYPAGVITKEKMNSLETLNAADREITNLQGLEHATALQSLELLN